MAFIPDYYASSAASGGGVGTLGDPFTLQELVDALTDTDVGALINDGTYTPAAQIDIDTDSASAINPIYLTSCNALGVVDGSVSIISGSGLGAGNLVDISVAHWIISNIRFTAAPAINVNLSGSNYHRFINCEIDNAGSHGVSSNISGPTFFANCNIHHNGGRGLSASAYPGGRFEIHNCDIHHNTSDGVYDQTGVDPRVFLSRIYSNGGRGWYSDTAAMDRCLFVNNIFFNNSSDGVYIEPNSQDLVLYNNIFRSNGGYGVSCNCNEGVFQLFDNNCYHNNTSGHTDHNGGTPYGENNVLSNPQFTSEVDGSEDFTLQDISPCIAAGLGYGGHWNIGVAQTELSAGGIKIHPGMNGGFNG